MIEYFSSEKIISLLLTPALRVALVVVIAFVANRFALIMIKNLTGHFLKSRVQENSVESPDEKRVETLKKAFGSIFSTVIWVLALLTLLPIFGINITPILAGLGIGGLALGLAAQTIVKDYISGIFILLEDQFSVGEKIEVAGKVGVVEDFNLRRTVVKANDGSLFYVPNSQIIITANLKQQNKI
ncbi:MAG: mechanosensitive ion channel [Candidatus Pacebacteria bacterium]|nr:mechanosensitive ion channel [Candidatus Paceibacterota bacterium]